MKSFPTASIGSFLLAGVVLSFGWPGKNPSFHMATMGNSRMATTSSHGEQTQSQETPKQLLDQDSKLSANLQRLLPAGTTPQQACSGFKNLGQCVAAIHVSHNLGIPFSDLKSKITGSNAESLGKAIHDLRPNADFKRETKKAKHQAQGDMNDSES